MVYLLVDTSMFSPSVNSLSLNGHMPKHIMMLPTCMSWESPIRIKVTTLAESLSTLFSVRKSVNLFQSSMTRTTFGICWIARDSRNCDRKNLRHSSTISLTWMNDHVHMLLGAKNFENRVVSIQRCALLWAVMRRPPRITRSHPCWNAASSSDVV